MKAYIAIKALKRILDDGDALSGDECAEIADEALKQIHALIDCPSDPGRVPSADPLSAVPELLEKAQALLDSFGGNTPSWCAAEAQALASAIGKATA